MRTNSHTVGGAGVACGGVGGGGVVALITGSFQTVFFHVLLGVAHELFAVLAVFLREVGAQRVLRLRVVHQRHQRVDYCARGKRECASVWVRASGGCRSC